jgi:hypothetical protein
MASSGTASYTPDVDIVIEEIVRATGSAVAFSVSVAPELTTSGYSNNTVYVDRSIAVGGTNAGPTNYHPNFPVSAGMTIVVTNGASNGHIYLYVRDSAETTQL